MFVAFHEVLSDISAGPAERLRSVAYAFRSFAHQHPRRYVLAMTAEVAVTRPDEDLLVEMILPIQAIMAELTGEAASLSALRGFLALLHGFVMLEVHQQLQRGGDLDAAFDDSLAPISPVGRWNDMGLPATPIAGTMGRLTRHH